MSREEVSKIYGRTERMVRLWITRFNESGIDGLVSKPIPGRPPKIKFQKLQDLLLPVLEDPSQAGVLHWTGVKLHGWLQEKVGISVGYSTVIRYLHELNYNLRVPQPWPERQDQKLREEFLRQLQTLLENPKVELWFGDECGVEGDPRPRRRWTARGSRPKVPYLGDHIRANVIGSVCPSTGECFTMIYNGVDTDVFQHFLDAQADAIPHDSEKVRYLVVDNASWHKAARLNWHHFRPLFLPPYSPDYNPIERLWLRLKADYLVNFFAKSRDELIQKLSAALSSLMSAPEQVAAQCRFRPNPT